MFYLNPYAAFYSAFLQKQYKIVNVLKKCCFRNRKFFLIDKKIKTFTINY